MSDSREIRSKRETRPIVADADDIRGIYQRIGTARIESRGTALALLCLVVLLSLGALAICRSDLARTRAMIHKRSRDRITSEQVHRLFEMHIQQHHEQVCEGSND